MTKPNLDKILTRADRGESVEAIAKALDLTAGHVYSVLRRERPKRTRKPRATTSDLPRMIKGLYRQGHKPARIAVVLGITRQYVSQVLGR